MSNDKKRSYARRRFLGGMVGLGLTATMRPAHAWDATENQTAVDDPQLILGGGPDSLPGQIAPLLSHALERGLNLDMPLRTRTDVGRDGVTAANLFDTGMAADGATALVAPGAALVASLSGDPRVHFDYSRWVPIMMAQRPVVTLARAELHRSLKERLEGWLHDHPVRLAVSQPTGVELASLLGLSLLGLHPVPVEGLASQDAALRALQNGTVDAVQLTSNPAGESIEKIIAQAPSGTLPMFHIGNEELSLPSFGQSFEEARRRQPGGPLYDAWQSVALAASTGLTVALPMLTPAPLVARWRHAATLAAETPELRNWSRGNQVSLVSGAESAPLLSALTPDLTALLALRRWINNNTPRWRLGQETRPT
ncbi:hypothetical protein NCH01_24460 [Neoasaia chiangmaiensis]|uniref:Uncharacterized protein n=1 Tax=Neoasaia chiangmaiensis TaxID=320497 RepID=A0A1U9KMX0_9PROT|nr:hypothetical protein [Neoasaia chiangmaiensis]AQS87142.1 hypothetical protein A0U93_03440 [Neoasaia chiangmaiensis]GEN16015.1 hypothetical protein NCH01_24460 [Neoasaia chiangmaiensis]